MNLREKSIIGIVTDLLDLVKGVDNENEKEDKTDYRDEGGVLFKNYKDFDSSLPVAERNSKNEVLAALANLDPSGVWPPVADFDHWPECCMPFAELCDSMGDRLLVYPPPRYETRSKESKHLKFRRWMREFLDEHVNLEEVMAALALDSPNPIGSNTRLGLVGCFTMLSLAYRWGAIPVVTAATNEKTLADVDFPPAIRMPYVALCDYYGIVAAPASFPFMMGNLQWPKKGQPEFRCRFCFHKKRLDTQLESTFRAAISLSEVTGIEVYKAMARVVGAMDAGDTAAAEKAMVDVSNGVKEVFKVIFEQFVHGTPDMKRLFILYIQEPSGWGLDGLHGLSASQLLSLRAMDAFCSFKNDSTMAGMIIELDHYTTAPMRRFTNALRKARVGERLAKDKENELGQWTPKTFEVFEELVKRVRMFRQSHRRFVDSYITKGQKMDRPTVTSLNGLLYSEYNKSQKLLPVIASDEKQDSTETMDEMLAGRVHETVVPWKNKTPVKKNAVQISNDMPQLNVAMKRESSAHSLTSLSSMSDESTSTSSSESNISLASLQPQNGQLETRSIADGNTFQFVWLPEAIRHMGLCMIILLWHRFLNLPHIAVYLYLSPVFTLWLISLGTSKSYNVEKEKKLVTSIEESKAIPTDLAVRDESEDGASPADDTEFEAFLAFLNTESTCEINPKQQLEQVRAFVSERASSSQR
eukprot:CAMPEP_0183711750 /NCGR_PEP_ID=MMETSP0737-20130205/7164_1 /TAXON_ID=385413 /ORGANISM="Thalassiosira miniscula, Strain CCMP1093" /LENGTH=697 /DNA_ID=CAMNT_0025940317 /DNA_START=258 /DNA_END=2351 /DNA_ORIENTATION=+